MKIGKRHIGSYPEIDSLGRLNNKNATRVKHLAPSCTAAHALRIEVFHNESGDHTVRILRLVRASQVHARIQVQSIVVGRIEPLPPLHQLGNESRIRVGTVATSLHLTGGLLVSLLVVEHLVAAAKSGRSGDALHAVNVNLAAF